MTSKVEIVESGILKEECCVLEGPSAAVWNFSDVSHSAEILKHLNELRLNGIFTDVVLKGQFTPGTKSVKYIWDMESNNYY